APGITRAAGSGWSPRHARRPRPACGCAGWSRRGRTRSRISISAATTRSASSSSNPGCHVREQASEHIPILSIYNIEISVLVFRWNRWENALCSPHPHNGVQDGRLRRAAVPGKTRAEDFVSWSIVIAGLIVGLLIGMTGAGGGALMTPILILLFGVTPSTAVSSDIVASAIMKPFGGAVHYRRGTVHMGLVGWLCVGSVPAAFAGVFVDRSLGSGQTMQQNIEYAMGAAIFLAAGAMIYR